MVRVARRGSGSPRLIVLAAAWAGCSGERAPPPPPLPVPAAQDASVGAVAVPGAEPAVSARADEAPSPPSRASVRPRNRPPRPIDVTLKSDPQGALAEVDGHPIGTTPTLWPGESDGLAHEFTFSLAGHAKVRYRFVPVTSGVLHARLQPIGEAPNGALAPLLAPRLAPEGRSPPSPSSPEVPPSPPSPAASSPSTSPASGSSSAGPPASGSPASPAAGSPAAGSPAAGSSSPASPAAGSGEPRPPGPAPDGPGSSR